MHIRDDRRAVDPRAEQMVEFQLRRRGICDERVLDAMRRVPRDAFVPEHLRDVAYEDGPLSIGCGQTISQPWIVARMLEGADVRSRVRLLDVGTGSGYAAAVAAEMGAEVYSVERHEDLGRQAEERLSRLGYQVRVRIGDGTLGWPEAAPFDAIVVAAGAPSVPPALRRQLAIGGRLVIPVGHVEAGQSLLRIERLEEDDFRESDLALVRFVPLIGAEGWLDEREERAAAERDGQDGGGLR